MLYASEVNRKALRRTLISCTAGTAEKKKKKAKQKGALFPVILKEAGQTTRKRFVSLPPAQRQNVQRMSNVNWYSG